MYFLLQKIMLLSSLRSDTKLHFFPLLATLSSCVIRPADGFAEKFVTTVKKPAQLRIALFDWAKRQNGRLAGDGALLIFDTRFTFHPVPAAGRILISPPGMSQSQRRAHVRRPRSSRRRRRRAPPAACRRTTRMRCAPRTRRTRPSRSAAARVPRLSSSNKCRARCRRAARWRRLRTTISNRRRRRSDRVRPCPRPSAPPGRCVTF